MPIANQAVESTSEPSHDPIQDEGLPHGIRSWQSIIDSETEPPSNTVESLIEEGAVSLLVARQKEGKSMLAAQLAIDVSYGEPFLSRLQTKRGRVLYVDYENRTHRLKARGLDLAKGRQMNDVLFAAFDRISERNLGLDGEHQRRLAEVVAALQPTLLVLDPLRLGTSSDLLDPNRVVQILTRVSSLQEASPHTAILLVHHLTKGQSDSTLRLQDDPRAWIDRTYGSQALLAHVETIIGLERDAEELYTLATVPRSSEPIIWALEKVPDSERFMLADAASQIRTWPPSLYMHWQQLPPEFSWTEGSALVGNSTLDRIRRRAMPLGLLTQDPQSKRYRKAIPAGAGRRG